MGLQVSSMAANRRRLLPWLLTLTVLAGCTAPVTLPDASPSSSPVIRSSSRIVHVLEPGTPPAYAENLAVPVEEAHYYSNFSGAFHLNGDALEKLRQNGFVVVGQNASHDVEMMYRFYWVNDLPVFISADTILHAGHLLFDEMLKTLEEEALLPELEAMSRGLLEESIRVRSRLPSTLGDVARDAVIFFSVPNALLGTNATIPADVKDEVDETVRRIQNATYRSHAEQDWTQYKPRGHYDTDALRPYFRAMMWYGRTAYNLSNDPELLHAAVISTILESSGDAKASWERIYDATTRLIGRSDSLNHEDLSRALTESVGAVDAALLSDPNALAALKQEIKGDEYYRQRILSAVLMVSPEDALDGRPVEFPKIYQFMGQRYVLDSDLMQQVMFDRVPLYENPPGTWNRRGLPSGLDVAAALGSFRAVDHLQEELARYNYASQLNRSRDAVAATTEEFWQASTYSRQLYALRELLAPSGSAPGFSTTAAWATLKINSALGSWAELRHDTILYAKQPYSVGFVCSTPEGWVEPDPGFFLSMADLADSTNHVIRSFEPIAPDAVSTLASVYAQFAELNDRLAAIAQKEVDETALSEDDVRFIRDVFVLSRNSYTGREVNYGWLPQLLDRARIDDPDRDARIIADVATDPGDEGVTMTPPRVLHVGVGDFRHVIVAYQKPDGDWHLAAGPVYSYYEFPEPGFTRLNDEEWKERLAQDGAQPPVWAGEFSAP